jgi:hypothetical protein
MRFSAPTRRVGRRESSVSGFQTTAPSVRSLTVIWCRQDKGARCRMRMMATCFPDRRGTLDAAGTTTADICRPFLVGVAIHRGLRG